MTSRNSDVVHHGPCKQLQGPPNGARQRSIIEVPNRIDRRPAPSRLAVVDHVISGVGGCSVHEPEYGPIFALGGTNPSE